MKTLTRTVSRLIVVGGALVWFATVAAANDDVTMEVNPGTVSFEVATNVPALRVHGKSNSLSARARLGSGPKGLVLEDMEASVPVRSLETGLALRDEHMRRYIFTTPDGQVPDVHFSGERAECLTSGSGERSTCTVSGTLTIRGITRPFVMTMTLTEGNGVVRASGNGAIKLSTYGIDQPSQLGVRTTDDIQLKLELTAKRVAAHTTARSMGTR